MTAVGPVLTEVSDFADQTGVAVLVIHHPPKDAPKKAIHAFSGSLAFVAAPRLVFVVAEEQGTDRKLLLAAKNNLGPLAPGLGYRVADAYVDHGIKTSVIEWDDEPVTVSANEALRAANGGGPSKIEQAKELLRDQLQNGPMAADQLIEMAKSEGIGERTLQEAKKQLGVKAVKDKAFQGRWKWKLPGRKHPA